MKNKTFFRHRIILNQFSPFYGNDNGYWMMIEKTLSFLMNFTFDRLSTVYRVLVLVVVVGGGRVGGAGGG